MSQDMDGEQDALEPVFEHPMERPAEQPPARPGYILLVDDDEGVRQIVHDLLDDEGYTLIATSTGADALARAPEWPPAMVLLDSTLQGEHPREVAGALRQRAGWGQTPLVLFTATERKRAIAMARELGTAEIFAKPFELDEMLALVKRYLAPPHAPASAQPDS